MTVSMSAMLAVLEGAGVAVKSLVDAPSGSEGGWDALAIRGVEHDSRRVGPGDLFVAWAGAASDAHDFVAAAARRGAAAAVVERLVAGAGLPQVHVDNARLAAAAAAGFAAGSPWPRMRVAAVTGTNGKTTTSLLLRTILERTAPAAAIGTFGLTGPDGRVQEGTAGLTTPGPVRLAEWMSSLERSGVEAVVLEASSHALDQFRLDGVRFDATAFTNLTQDHLDYHGNLERYRAAKARLLELRKDAGTAVINADDPAWRALRPQGPVLAYGLEPGVDLGARNVRLSASGSAFDLEWNGQRTPVTLRLPGAFNVSNALCAAACALALGTSPEDVARGLAAARPVPGRLERIAKAPFPVFVDFAHTPDALEQVLKTLRPLVSGRLFAVFGAGGDRDPAKRPLMGAAVARWADVAVVTSDNPRTEDPAAIVVQVSAGTAAADHGDGSGRRCRVVEIVDRREAIRHALDAATPGDAVLLAGKGHESYQEVGTERLPFNERRIVAAGLAARSPGPVGAGEDDS